MKFDLGKNKLAFHVRRKGNPLAARQVDAARQVLLEAAFGFPVRASDKELADVLGAGYSLTTVGEIGPVTPLEAARASIVSHCPGALEESPDAWTIPVDHPQILFVTLAWRDERLNVSFTPSAAYDRERLSSCVASKEGEATHLVLLPDAIGLDAPLDAAAFVRTFGTLAACR